MNRRSCAFALFVVGCAWGCGDDGAGADAGPPDDVGPGRDAGPPPGDAGRPDGAARDAGDRDAGAPECAFALTGVLRAPDDSQVSLLDGASENTSTTCTPVEGTRGPEDFWALVVEEPVTVAIVVDGAPAMAVAVRTSCDEPLSELGCRRSDGPGLGATLTITLEPGTYFVVVDTLGTGTGGEYVIGVEERARPLETGESCRADDECEGGVCLVLPAPSGPQRVCSLECTPGGTDCPVVDGLPWRCDVDVSRCAPLCDLGEECPEGTECVPSFAPGPELCVAVAEECRRPSDCPEGQVCELTGDGSRTFFQCVASPRGELETGEPCDPRGAPPGICHGFCPPEGVCSGACVEDADCPEGMRCSGFLVPNGMGTPETSDDVFEPLTACVAWEGSRAACTADGDCEGEEVCALFSDTEGDAHRQCRTPAPDDAGFWELVNDDPRTPDELEAFRGCATRVQFNWGQRQRCTRFCETSADCADPDDGWSCRVWRFDADSDFGVCVESTPCADTADCEGDRVCTPILDGSEAPGACIEPVGGAGLGEACDFSSFFGFPMSCGEDAECVDAVGPLSVCSDATNVCVPSDAGRCAAGLCTYLDVCGEACDADSDCGAGLYCAGIELRYWHSGTPAGSDDLVAPARLCFPFPGSRAVCARGADCAVTGETCSLYLGASGVETRCRTAIAGGAAVGEPCDRRQGSEVVCATTICDYEDGDGNPDTGRCTAPCATDGDCPAGTACRDARPFGLDTLRTCRVPGAGDLP